MNVFLQGRVVYTVSLMSMDFHYVKKNKKTKKQHLGVPTVAQRKRIQLVSMRMQV